ncbi:MULTISPECIES: pyrroline-5-carboxylate reductase [Flavobacterium]|uniref:pyrroline-5-carboxylate reductase n=1 Tax=Flavobacterium TaxID=237 RepID=UPI000745BCB4|nr:MULTISPECIES: pyrroline-5-carboxylate reductase [Flavobacterium]AMA49126.1 pyrroline-5-carboxylate reductase [Flavobacterium covae]MCJ1810009.1 pyrroline-5-carboxylate reductase [Flavobacterium covae]OXA79474.1 pyrroline-5-carboxylate reductase [Flavobacterium columnare NBRC 100251 = ATCC 23463]
MKIAIVGYGNLGKTFAGSFVKSHFIRKEDIFVYTRTLPKREDCFLIPLNNFSTDHFPFTEEIDILILAVKPQEFEKVAKVLRDKLNKEIIVLSVMAGVSIQKIANLLQVNKIVRSMPNLGTQIGQGMTVFSASDTIDRKELFIIQNLINTTGKSIYVENEGMLNPATAVSGSGPAYVFYFMNAMIQAAKELGFSDAEAELLVHQTFLGAVSLKASLGLSNDELIKKVASKGGTTEQAILIFNKNSLSSIISKAIEKANLKSIELGD